MTRKSKRPKSGVARGAQSTSCAATAIAGRATEFPLCYRRARSACTGRRALTTCANGAQHGALKKRDVPGVHAGASERGEAG
jgi:hypothetical protein